MTSSALARETQPKIAFSVAGGSLADALRALSIQSKTGLLFSPDTIGERRSPPLSGSMPLEGALTRLLKGTGLYFRHTAPDTIIIFAPEAIPSAAIPEILVVGRRTQNADIRRTENDIQPYQVASARDIVSSHADNVDQFLRARLPSDAGLAGPAQNPNVSFASNRSEANLHGLGTDQTLILVDGMRMPGVPSQTDQSLAQPDLNGIPLLAIERIETFTGTAGGIYGPGATGGVINVVLKRDYRGADLSATYGLTSRGDAVLKRIDARIGFTPDKGRTDVMITASRSQTAGLDLGSRDYSVAARAALIHRDIDDFVLGSPSINGILVTSGLFGENLSIGGNSIGSQYTYIPTGYTGFTSDGGATLVANAGKVPNALSPDANGEQRSLTNDATTTSLLVNVRHRFGDRVEAFVDLIAFQNNGVARAGYGITQEELFAPSPYNPFDQPIAVVLALPGFSAEQSNRLRTIRLSGGLIVRLPYRWKADLNFNVGRTRNIIDQRGYSANGDLYLALATGQAGAGGEPVLNPFGDWTTFVQALQAYRMPYVMHYERRDKQEDGSVRLAGPLFELGGGAATLSLLAERRRDVMPSGPTTTVISDTAFFQRVSQEVSSLYGELRAPLLSRDAAFWPLRGLEAQLAIRYDDTSAHVPSALRLPTSYQYLNDPISARQSTVAYTAGLRFFPQDHLMLRASVATGTLPPTPQQLLPFAQVIPSEYFIGDPKRGGNLLGSEAPFVLEYGGSPNLKAERSRSVSIGIVLNPEDIYRPRISIDYTRIRKHDEISEAHDGDMSFFLENEALYPGRITRAPLTAGDTAAGFTGGVITAINATDLNIGRTGVDAVDFRIEDTLRIGGKDRIRPYVIGTWQPRLVRQSAPGFPATNYVDYTDGPLRWRGNGGFDWDHGPLSIEVNGQYYATYIDSGAGLILDASRDDYRVPAQFYLDLSGSYRVDLRGEAGRPKYVEFQLGIKNLLDHRPPIVTTQDLGYSYYGAPRRRRFEFTAAAHF